MGKIFNRSFYSAFLIVSFCLLISSQLAHCSDRPILNDVSSNLRPISQQTYLSIIRPSIRRLIIHYQAIIRELAPDNKAIAPLQDDLLELKEKWMQWIGGCSHEYSEECEAHLLVLLKHHQNIESQSRALHQITLLKFPIGNLTASEQRAKFQGALELIEPLDQLLDLSSLATTHLEWAISSYQKDHRPYLNLFLPIQKMADQLFSLWEIAHVNLAPGGQRNDFRIIYAHFIRPLTILDKGPSPQIQFSQEVQDLNLTINYFQRIVTTPSRGWPKAFLNLTESLKDEWNFILRQIQ